MLSRNIKQHDFRLIRLLCMDCGVQITLIPLTKHCVSLSDHIMVSICSHTLVTQGSTASLIPIGCRNQRWLLATSALISQGYPSCDWPLVNIKVKHTAP